MPTGCSHIQSSFLSKFVGLIHFRFHLSDSVDLAHRGPLISVGKPEIRPRTTSAINAGLSEGLAPGLPRDGFRRWVVLQESASRRRDAGVPVGCRIDDDPRTLTSGVLNGLNHLTFVITLDTLEFNAARLTVLNHSVSISLSSCRRNVLAPAHRAGSCWVH